MIDNNNLIFANEKELINFYKNKKINAFDLLILIDQVKKNIARYTIFNLQKINPHIQRNVYEGYVYFAYLPFTFCI